MRVIPVHLLVFFAVAGCQGRSAPAPSQATPVAATNPTPEVRKTMESPDYANWKTFKVGAGVKRRSVTRIGPNETVSVDTVTLVEVNDREVVVSRQNTTERSDGSYKQVNPPEKRTYAKSFTIPKGMKAEDFEKPALAAKEAGDETVTVVGKPIKAKVFKWTDRAETGPMAIIVWLSDELPGRIVRQEINVDAIKSQTVEEIVEVTIR